MKSKIFFSRYLTESSGTKYETKQNFAKLGEGLAIINQNKVKRTETLYVKVRVHGLGSLQAFFVGLWRSPYNIFTLTFVQYYSVTPWRYIQYSARKKPYCTCTFHLLSNSLKFEECKIGSVFHLSFSLIILCKYCLNSQLIRCESECFYILAFCYLTVSLPDLHC